MDNNDQQENLIVKKKPFPIWAVIAVVAVLVGTMVGAAVFARAGNEKKVTRQLELARKYVSGLDYEQAIIAYQAAIDINPKNADAYLELAELFLENNDKERAEEILNEAMNLVSDEDRERIADKVEKIRNAAASTDISHEDINEADSEEEDFPETIPVQPDDDIIDFKMAMQPREYAGELVFYKGASKVHLSKYIGKPTIMIFGDWQEDISGLDTALDYLNEFESNINAVIICMGESGNNPEAVKKLLSKYSEDEQKRVDIIYDRSNVIMAFSSYKGNGAYAIGTPGYVVLDTDGKIAFSGQTGGIFFSGRSLDAIERNANYYARETVKKLVNTTSGDIADADDMVGGEGPEGVEGGYDTVALENFPEEEQKMAMGLREYAGDLSFYKGDKLITLSSYSGKPTLLIFGDWQEDVSGLDTALDYLNEFGNNINAAVICMGESGNSPETVKSLLEVYSTESQKSVDMLYDKSNVIMAFSRHMDDGAYAIGTPGYVVLDKDGRIVFGGHAGGIFCSGTSIEKIDRNTDYYARETVRRLVNGYSEDIADTESNPEISEDVEEDYSGYAQKIAMKAGEYAGDLTFFKGDTPVTLSAYSGKPTVVIFGDWQEDVSGLDTELDYIDEFGERINAVIICVGDSAGTPEAVERLLEHYSAEERECADIVYDKGGVIMAFAREEDGGGLSIGCPGYVILDEDGNIAFGNNAGGIFYSDKSLDDTDQNAYDYARETMRKLVRED